MNKKYNEIIIEGDVAKIICYCKGERYEVLIDAEDVDKVKDYRWYVLAKRLYCYTKLNKSIVGLHRIIMDCPKNMVVDHINHDTLDNRKCNLRVCTQGENMMNVSKSTRNRSGKKGVNWDKVNQKWKVELKCKGKYIFLGRYEDLEEAKRVRIEAELKYFGEYANPD